MHKNKGAAEQITGSSYEETYKERENNVSVASRGTQSGAKW